MSTLLSETKPQVKIDRQWQQFIGGKFIEGTTSRTLMNPASGERLCDVQEASSEQVAEAIKSARAAFDGGTWRKTTAQERGRMLEALAEQLDKRAGELAHYETLNSGKPLREALFDVQESANCLRYHAGLVQTPLGTTVDVPGRSVTQIVREPIGVCGMIVPWNYPMLTAIWKIAPALATGNTCVLKPSEFTPITALLIAEIFQELDLPAGVFNVVCGDGGTAGQPLAESMLVDKISFTGSARAGRLVARAAISSNLKKVTLELGGKSPMIVFDDVDVSLAVDYALYAIFVHAGQVCSAGSRFIIHEKLFDSFCRQFKERAEAIRVGPGLDENTQMGPLCTQQHFERVLQYIDTGKQEGANVLTGGNAPRGGRFAQGYFVAPTALTNVKPAMQIVQDEIFGPVATIESFTAEEEAVSLANCTQYGLAAAVFTNDVTRAYRVTKQVKAGVNWINNYHPCYNEAPFGGYKQSGWGRECGTFGIQAYTEVKQINLNLDPQPVGWFAE